jgi:Icc-related predicted phosphoesterase
VPRIVCISDTHTHHWNLNIPDGDILVHAGDSTRIGKPEEIQDFNRWLGTLPHPHKVIISGNHDFSFQTDGPAARSWITNAHYLQDSGVELCGLKFWGSPWQPRFFDWAFNLERGSALKYFWDQIPQDTDVLITHSPPFGILDQTARGEPVGCEELRKAVIRIGPKLHVFGHIHEDYGQRKVADTLCVNAATCTLKYKPTNSPIVVDL